MLTLALSLGSSSWPARARSACALEGLEGAA